MAIDIENEMIETIRDGLVFCVDKAIVEAMLYPNIRYKYITFLDTRKQYPFQRVNITIKYDGDKIIEEQCDEGPEYLTKFKAGKFKKYIKKYEER